MLTPGRFNTLEVVDILPFGYHLADPDDLEGQHILLKESDKALSLGNKIEVFVYTQASGDLVGSSKTPKIQLDEFASLVVMGSHAHGYFFDWGMEDDLYAPEGQVHTNLDIGKAYVVRLVKDKLGKLVATTKIERFLSQQTSSVMKNKTVELLLYSQTPLGFKAIVDNQYQGLLFKSDLIAPTKVGDRLTGYIKQLRNDGKIDLSLQLQNKQGRIQLNDEILEDLKAHGGMSTLTDKSTPEEIFTRFKVSKGAYKKAIGALFKDKKIRIQKNCLYLND